ncbi:MAG TPA: flavoprotein [Usitatibacteraceae bacterium]|nr:flavoprotein [Usitatibacteraceae bacterium]
MKTSATPMRRLIVGISGASGVIYGIRALQVLKAVPDIETHLVLSAAASRYGALIVPPAGPTSA